MSEALLLALMNAICLHQTRSDRHPLTCGNDSNHGRLFPVLDGPRVILRCPGCDYRQEYVPPIGLRP